MNAASHLRLDIKLTLDPSPYFRPGTDGGDDDPALNDGVPQDRWPGLRTRDDMRAEVNARRPDASSRM